MQYLHHSTLQFFIAILLEKQEKVEISKKRGIQLSKEAVGPFELETIFSQEDYGSFWKDLQNLKIFNLIQECEFMPVEDENDEAEVYISRLGVANTGNTALTSTGCLPTPLYVQKHGLPSVFITSKEKILGVFTEYLKAFQKDKLDSNFNYYHFKKQDEKWCQVLMDNMDKYGTTFTLEPFDEGSRIFEYFCYLHTLKQVTIKDAWTTSVLAEESNQKCPFVKITLEKTGIKRVKQQVKKVLSPEIEEDPWKNKIAWEDFVVNLDKPQATYKDELILFRSKKDRQYKLLSNLLKNRGILYTETAKSILNYRDCGERKESKLNKIRNVGVTLIQKIERSIFKGKKNLTVDVYISVQKDFIEICKKPL